MPNINIFVSGIKFLLHNLIVHIRMWPLVLIKLVYPTLKIILFCDAIIESTWVTCSKCTSLHYFTYMSSFV